MPLRLLLLLVLALIAPPAAARPFPPAAVLLAEQHAVLPMVDMPGDPARLYVRIDDPALGERIFFVDTGYSRTTCDDDFIAALGIEPAWTSARSRGELGSVRLQKAALPSFSLGGHRVEGLTCAVRDLATTSSVISAPGQPTAGVLGADLLGRFVVGIDPVAGILTLADPAQWPVEEGHGVVPLRLERRHGPRMRLPVLVDGQEIWPLLDTGATRTQLDAARLGLPLVAEREGVDRGSGASNESTRTFRFHQAESVVLAGQEVGPLRILDRPRARSVPGLLGQDVLGRYRLRIDATHGWVEVLPVAEGE
ncbi:MAG: retropepsin-like aspartic protease [Pseudomonadota bacterium]